MKKILIEAGSFYGQRSGVGRYALNLSQALAELRSADSIELFSFLRPGRKPITNFQMPRNVTYRFIRWFPGRAFSLLMRYGVSLPLELLGVRGGDVVLFPNFISWASWARKRRVAVIHDLAFLQYPEFVQHKNLRYLQRQVGKSIKRSSLVVAVSDFTRQSVIDHYGLNPQKIVTIPNAVDHARFNAGAAKNTAVVRKKYVLQDRYLLYVGNIEPRKNIEGMLASYALAYPKQPAQLVVVGAKGWNDSGIQQRVAQLSELPIRFLDYVDDGDLPALYAGSELFVFPSFYEGFGLPVLEAMACGCPVICSDTTSLPEVAGEAAYFVDPSDTAALAAGIVTLLSDKKLRSRLVAAGYENAQRYSWATSAKLLSQQLDSLL